MPEAQVSVCSGDEPKPMVFILFLGSSVQDPFPVRDPLFRANLSHSPNASHPLR